ncbi:MAG: alanine racemase, partial [Clostridia bacterium]|nr:alanine racemase [Clostridia bacterium]
MNNLMSRTWLEIDLDAIEENYRRIKHDIGESEIMAVVKANAYGLGAPGVSKFLEEIGVRFFAVACLEEALELRQAGIKGEI